MNALVKKSASPGLNFSTTHIPKPGAGEVLVKVKMAAICGSDLHIYQWDSWAAGMNLKVPGISGHECVAEVVELGDGVSSLKVGDRISVETHIPCEECDQCLNGAQHICENMQLFGLHIDGCFAEWVVVPEKCARKIPDVLSDKVGAIMEPLGVGVHAAQVANVKGKNVAILGAGPIGIFAACASLALGAKSVVISDINEKRLQIASKCPNLQTWNSREIPAKDVLGNENPEIIIETTGNRHAIQEAIPYIKKGGIVAMVGLFREEVGFDFSKDIILKEITVRGIHGRRMWSTWELTEKLLLEKKLDVDFAITHILPLEDYEEAFRIAIKGEGMKVLFSISE